MKTTSIVAAVVALSLSLSNVAFAQTGPHVGPGDMERYQYRDGGRGHGADRRDDHRANERRDHRADDRRDHRAHDRRDHRADNRRDHRADDRRDHRRDGRWEADRHDQRQWQSVTPRHDPRRHNDYGETRYLEQRWDHRDPRWNQGWHRGAGPRHDFYRGSRLPSYYRSPTYVVEDWHGHHLRRPPTGYHWVQAGGDYVLAAIATGVILSIVLSN